MPVEGLRSYLALWVLADHALYLAGYRQDSRDGLPELIYRLFGGTGPYAVDVFIIIRQLCDHALVGQTAPDVRGVYRAPLLQAISGVHRPAQTATAEDLLGKTRVRNAMACSSRAMRRVVGPIRRNSVRLGDAH